MKIVEAISWTAIGIVIGLIIAGMIYQHLC